MRSAAVVKCGRYGEIGKPELQREGGTSFAAVVATWQYRTVRIQIKSRCFLHHFQLYQNLTARRLDFSSKKIITVDGMSRPPGTTGWSESICQRLQKVL
jgi:hypothetical protein